MMNVLRLLFFIALTFVSQAQNLTISSAAESGTITTSGSNPITISASGTANLSVSTIETHLNNGISVIVSSSTGSVTVSSALSKTAGGAASLTLQAANGTMQISSNISSSSNALSLVLWTNLTSNSGAGLLISNCTINTNGGHIYAGGGATTETLNTLTVPQGYTNSTTASNSHGIAISSSNINSNGGEIRMKGSISAVDGLNSGLTVYGSTTLNSGAGNLSLFGLRTGNPWAGAGLYIGTDINNPSTTVGTGNVAISSTSGNIYLEGNTANISNVHAWTHGFAIVEYYGDDVSINSTTGNITIYGDGTSAAVYSGEATGFVIQSSTPTGLTNITTDGGNISITGKSSNDASGDIGLALRAHNSIGNLTIGDANTGNVTLRFGSLQTTAPSNPLAGRISIAGTGTCLLEGINGEAFATAVDLGNAYTFGAGLTNLQIGSTTNNQTLTVSTALNINGPASLYGSVINQQANVSLLATNAKYLAKATGNINLSANITTNNGDVILWSDSDNNSAGAISLADNVIVNSANGSTLSNLSGGGKIVFAGGADNGTISGTANDNIPDNYSQSSTTNGLKLGSSENNHTQLFSGGGDIILNGRSTNNGVSMENIGWYQVGRLTANSGNAGIIINGMSTNFYAVNFVFTSGALLTGPKFLSLTSNKSSGSAIQINGTSSNNYGVVFNYNSPKELLATGGGNIQITGVGGANNGIFLQNLNILASSGDINLDGGSLGIKIPSGGARFGAFAGTAITSSTSNIKLIGNAFSVDDPNPVQSTSGFSTSGTITLEPKSTSFSSAYTWPSYLTSTSNSSGITIGKINNTANITVNAAHSIAGPISVYGGALTISNNLTSTNGDILLKGTSTSGTGVIALANTKTLTLDLSSNSTYSGAINGTGANVVKTGAGSTTLSATCGYTGSTTVNGGTLQFNENEAFNDITIANGATLALGPNKQFDLNGTLANNGALNLKSGATILHGSSNTITGSGSYIVEQAITGTNSGGTPNGRFWYLGSAVSNAFSTAFNAGGANVLKYRDEPTNQWVEITNDATTLVPGRGYYCQATANTTISFAGSSINNGAMTISNLSRSSGINFEGFNLVSNPYPSYLDWDAVTKTNVGNTMWYRTASGSTAASMVFDTYVAGTNGIGTNLNGNSVSNLIPPMQAFWVRVNQGQTSGSLALDNTMRAHFTSINGSVAGLKSTSNERDLFLRMNLLQADKKDQLIVYVNETATNGFDILDGEKMMQAGFPQFYTKAGDKKIVINGLNSAKKQQSLPITMELPTTGVHSFIIEDLEISNGLVWLEDKQEDIIQALEPGTVYEFYAASGMNAERFVLHFQLIDDAVPTNVYNEVNSSANFSGKGANVHAEAAGVVVIKLPASTEGVTDIQIRDAAGKVVYTGSTNALETSVQLSQANGIYYVTLNSNAGLEVRKVFIQQ
jgi:autotransporter-associated beta strand protein